jgi:hypothetical protein
MEYGTSRGYPRLDWKTRSNPAGVCIQKEHAFAISIGCQPCVGNRQPGIPAVGSFEYLSTLAYDPSVVDVRKSNRGKLYIGIANVGKLNGPVTAAVGRVCD